MPGPFRFAPPPLGPHTLARPRLLGRLQRRWAHRVTVLVAGAGFGKTTLLAQAVAENGLAPLGRDAWIGLEAGDADGDLGTDLVAAIRGGTPGPRAAASVAEIVLQMAPTPVCIILDDVHLLPAGCPGHLLVAELVSALPANGHLVIAARVDPDLPLARLAARGELLTLTEDYLAFDADELGEVARVRQVEPAALTDTGGWPAIVELAATAGRPVAREFLWQEVVQPLGAERRRVLAAIVELGGGDDTLVSAALGTPVSLEDALRGVPLVAAADGWHRPHPLWHPMARLRLADRERLELRRRAARELTARARFDDAFDLLAGADLWDEVPALLRASCGELTRHPPAPQLRRWLGRLPADRPRASSTALAVGVLASLEDPDHAAAPLRAAIAGFRAAGDADGELAAIAHLGRVAWWARDLDALGELGPRVGELARASHPVAEALDAVGRAVVADLHGDDAAMAEAVSATDPVRLGPAWAPALAWMRSNVHYHAGDAAAAYAITRAALDATGDRSFRDTLEAAEATARWQLGLDLDTDLTRHWPDLEAQAAGGVSHNVTVAAADLAQRRAHVGDMPSAGRLLHHARAHPAGDRPLAVVRIATAEASVLVAEGDEGRAAQVLRDALERHPLAGAARRPWRDTLSLTYLLVPETRTKWDDAALGGVWAESRDHAAAVVALRQGQTLRRHLPRLRLDSIDTIRVRLHHRFAAELAVGLHHAGRPEGAALLDALGQPGRARVRELGAGPEPSAAAVAKRLLAAVPAAPPHPIAIRALGPLTLQHDGIATDVPALRRERVRALLAFLVTRRAATRPQVIDALWPDLDDKAGANNLRVTLNHLHRALEPWRGDGDPPYFVRADGPQLRLAHAAQLHSDLDAFDTHLAGAEQAERDHAPTHAVTGYLAAIDLWRGELFSDVADAVWLDLERERVRIRYLHALWRAAQLQLASGDTRRADDLARRALQLDPWSEDAHGVLIGVALARGDRPAARRALNRATKAISELDIDIGPDLRRLAATINRAGESTRHT